MLDEEKAHAILNKFGKELHELNFKTLERCRLAGMSVNEAVAISSAALMHECLQGEMAATTEGASLLDNFDEERFIERIRSHIVLLKKTLAEKEVERLAAVESREATIQ